MKSHTDMNTPQDGGPAFPMPAHQGTNGEQEYPIYGMSLRDYFAAAALQGIMSYHNAERGDFHTNATPLIAAAFAYKLADKMLAARERKEDA